MSWPIIGLTLLAGYFFSNKKKESVEKLTKETQNVQEFEKPNGDNIYSSNKVNEVNQEILDKSLNMYKQAENPAISGVLPPLFNTYSIRGNLEVSKNIQDASSKVMGDINTLNKVIDVAKPQEPELDKRPMFVTETSYKGEPITQNNFTAFEQKPVDTTTSLLSGLPIELSHNNMIPFFGSNIKQNIEEFRNESILDLHNGNTSTFKHKKEIGKFFENKQQDINGTPIFTTSVNQDRYISSIYHQNEKPFQEERINAPISGTFNNSIRPSFKDVNELRPGNKPKESYEARTLSGKMGEVRGIQPQFNKNRPDKFMEWTQDHLFKTTGDVIAKKMDENYDNFKLTSRQDYNIEHYGPAGSKDFLATKQRTKMMDNSHELDMDSLVQVPKRHNFENDYIRNANGARQVNDYGKDTYVAFETERTEYVEPHILNANNPTMGNKIRLLDIAKSTNKETTLENDSTRNVKTEFNKGLIETYYSGISDFTAKTTSKETFGEDNYKGTANKPEGMGYVVNKFDAKTTGKEILSNNSYSGNAGYTSQKTSTENYDNAYIRDAKEELISGERPSGPQNFQISSGKNAYGDIKLTDNMLFKEERDERDLLNVNYSQIIPSKFSIGTQDRIRYDEDVEDTVFADRLQGNIVTQQLKDNPYSMYGGKNK